MTDPATNLAENLGIAGSNLAFAKLEMDPVRKATFLGKVVAAVSLSITDLSQIAPDPEAVQTAYERAAEGYDV